MPVRLHLHVIRHIWMACRSVKDSVLVEQLIGFFFRNERFVLEIVLRTPVVSSGFQAESMLLPECVEERNGCVHDLRPDSISWI